VRKAGHVGGFLLIQPNQPPRDLCFAKVTMTSVAR
jgi:hypothetical protein